MTTILHWLGFAILTGFLIGGPLFAIYMTMPDRHETSQMRFGW